jgi:CheY-like chemotaxis protein
MTSDDSIRRASQETGEGSKPSSQATTVEKIGRIGTTLVAALRILVVDDCEDSAETMALLLRFYGHEVEIAANGLTALGKARVYQPDVILLDIGLPGMSGYDLARLWSSPSPGKKPLLIAVTGYGTEADREHSAEAGIDLHLVKPVDPAELRGILERCQTAING